MYVEIKVVSDRTGNGLKVQLASEETSRHVEDVNRSVEVRRLWLPDGAEVFQDELEGACVQVPGERFPYTLTDAYHVYGKYGSETAAV